MSDVEFDIGNHEYWCSSLRNDGSGDFGKCNCKPATKPCSPCGDGDTAQQYHVHDTGSGEPTFCRNCGKPIVEDTSGRGWRHGETGPYLCCDTYAEPGGTPPASTVTQLEEAVKTAQRFHSERLWHDGDVRELSRIVALIGTELLALLRAAETPDILDSGESKTSTGSATHER